MDSFLLRRHYFAHFVEVTSVVAKSRRQHGFLRSAGRFFLHNETPDKSPASTRQLAGASRCRRTKATITLPRGTIIPKSTQTYNPILPTAILKEASRTSNPLFRRRIRILTTAFHNPTSSMILASRSYRPDTPFNMPTNQQTVTAADMAIHSSASSRLVSARQHRRREIDCAKPATLAVRAK